MLLVLYPSFISLLAFNLLGEVFGFCPSLIREVEELEKGHAFCSYVILFFVQCRPSTFAQAAKLRRMAAAKEKELANCTICNCSHWIMFICFMSCYRWKDSNSLTWLPDQQLHGNEIKLSYDLYLKVLNMTKVMLGISRLWESSFRPEVRLLTDTLGVHLGLDISCPGLLVLEGSSCLHITTTCSTLR